MCWVVGVPFPLTLTNATYLSTRTLDDYLVNNFSHLSDFYYISICKANRTLIRPRLIAKWISCICCQQLFFPDSPVIFCRFVLLFRICILPPSYETLKDIYRMLLVIAWNAGGQIGMEIFCKRFKGTFYNWIVFHTGNDSPSCDKSWNTINFKWLCSKTLKFHEISWNLN